MSLSINSSAVAQSAISLVAALTTLEAIREIPGAYDTGVISNVMAAKMIVAIIILTIVFLLLWKFDSGKQAHAAPTMSAPITPPAVAPTVGAAR
jgi:hypothetical protein